MSTVDIDNTLDIFLENWCDYMGEEIKEMQRQELKTIISDFAKWLHKRDYGEDISQERINNAFKEYTTNND